MTAKQFLALGEDPPGVHLELVNGEIYISPSQSIDHGHVIVELIAILGPFIDAHDLGDLNADIDTVFGEYEVRRPDVFVIRKDRLHLIKDDHGYDIPPDLAVEVLSPSSVEMDRGNKYRLYRSRHVPFYWLIDPHQRLFEAYVLADDDYRLAIIGRDKQTVSAPPFSDLEIPLAKLWRGV